VEAWTDFCMLYELFLQLALFTCLANITCACLFISERERREDECVCNEYVHVCIYTSARVCVGTKLIKPAKVRRAMDSVATWKDTAYPANTVMLATTQNE